MVVVEEISFSNSGIFNTIMKHITVTQPSITRRKPLTDSFNYVENEEDTFEDIRAELHATSFNLVRFADVSIRYFLCLIRISP